MRDNHSFPAPHQPGAATPSDSSRQTTPSRSLGWAWLGTGAAALLAACAAPVPAPVAGKPAPPAPAPVPAPLAQPEPPPSIVSEAVTPRDYRRDGARHLYSLNAHRIYKGKMPPLLQGVGTMQLELDHRGRIVALNWMRPPSHAGARAEIERTVRAAAPFPAPIRMGRVTYTETWLWDKSGQFQLDTLTEGQRNR